MKKQVVAGLMVAVAMISFGCSGRNAEFGVVDMKAVESKAEIVKRANLRKNRKKLLNIKRLKCSWYNQKRKIN